MLTREISCPFCDLWVELEYDISGGEPAVWYPNDAAYPGTPPALEVYVRGQACECDENNISEWVEENLREDLLQDEWEAKEAAEDAWVDAKISAMREERR